MPNICNSPLISGNSQIKKRSPELNTCLWAWAYCVRSPDRETWRTLRWLFIEGSGELALTGSMTWSIIHDCSWHTAHESGFVKFEWPILGQLLNCRSAQPHPGSIGSPGSPFPLGVPHTEAWELSQTSVAKSIDGWKKHALLSLGLFIFLLQGFWRIKGSLAPCTFRCSKRQGLSTSLGFWANRCKWDT